MFRSQLSLILRGIIIMAALMLSDGVAFGDITSANAVMIGCRNFVDTNNNRNPYDQGMCAGLIAGVSYMAEGTDFCSPSGVTLGQKLRVAVQYIEARAARWLRRCGLRR
jgi:Rap1a immunity proteins